MVFQGIAFDDLQQFRRKAIVCGGLYRRLSLEPRLRQNIGRCTSQQLSDGLIGFVETLKALRVLLRVDLFQFIGIRPADGIQVLSLWDA